MFEFRLDERAGAHARSHSDGTPSIAGTLWCGDSENCGNSGMFDLRKKKGKNIEKFNFNSRSTNVMFVLHKCIGKQFALELKHLLSAFC